MDLRDYAADVSTRDGVPVRIRAIRPDDKERLLAAFHELSARSVYFRFLESKRVLSVKELAYLTEIDFERHVGLVATVRQKDIERIVASGRYIVTDKPGKRAEVAFAVVDDYQGRGIATLLLQHLARIASAKRVEVFEAEVLGDNAKMLAVFERSGFDVRQSVDSGRVHVLLSISKPA